MHQQFYYQLRSDTKSGHEGRAHPLIAVDHSKEQVYPLAQMVGVATQKELDAWVSGQLGSAALEPTTRAHLEVAHTQPDGRGAARDAAEWSLYAEALLRQQRHRALIGDRPEQLNAWRQWLQEQPFNKEQVPAQVQEYFAQCVTGGDALALLQDSPSLEWNTAFMTCLNPTCKVDPAGKSHESNALQPRVMANKGRYGWTLSYSVTHLDYSQVYEVPKEYEDEEDDRDPLDIGVDVKEATASKLAAMAQKDESGEWKIRVTNVTESAGAWFDRTLSTLRHNKDIKREVLEGIVQNAVEAGIPQTQIIANELPKTKFQGSAVSKVLLEVVTGQDWERIEQQAIVLEGLGYKDELPLYMWLYFKNKPQESFDLPSLS